MLEIFPHNTAESFLCASLKAALVIMAFIELLVIVPPFFLIL
jgi:hypothetical protein